MKIERTTIQMKVSDVPVVNETFIHSKMFVPYSAEVSHGPLDLMNLSVLNSSDWEMTTSAQITTYPMPVFGETLLIRTIVLGALFLLSFIGNTATLIQMYRMRRRRSTINTLIVNLAIADLIVTFFCMAAEAIWSLTVQWLAGIAMCKIIRFLQGFGLLLSTYITVIISLDRCCVILDPISRNKAPQRVKIMILVSWCLSALFSIPQPVVFNVVRGPFHEDFYQCVDHQSYNQQEYKMVYFIFCLFIQFMIPLGIMIAAYGLIFITISRKSKEFRGNDNLSNSSDQGRGQVRNNLLKKAKKKALRMSIFIVLAFILCWFPYYVLFTGNAFGYWEQLHDSIYTGLSTVGLSNSMLNPIIYGAFQLCKVHRPRSWKKDVIPNAYGITPFLQRRHARPCMSTKNTKLTLLTTRRNTLVMCKCEEAMISRELASSLPCVVVMCSDQKNKMSETQTKRSSCPVSTFSTCHHSN